MYSQVAGRMIGGIGVAVSLIKAAISGDLAKVDAGTTGLVVGAAAASLAIVDGAAIAAVPATGGWSLLFPALIGWATEYGVSKVSEPLYKSFNDSIDRLFASPGTPIS